MADVEHPAVAQVDEPARGADDDVDTVLEGVDLGLVADAAVDGQDAEPAVRPGERQVASGRR